METAIVVTLEDGSQWPARKERLRRVRACLAEAGYDPNDAYIGDDRRMVFAPAIPFFVGWKAQTLSGFNPGCCWPCTFELGPGRTWDEYRTFCSHDVDPFCSEDVA